MLLLLDYRRDRVALSIHMAGCLFDATADLLRANPNPADLFERFIGWTARL
ncbi:hypothetical protein O7600_23405 [Micromonospora sp. WMMA1998]|uniref:hypothetical protein n=1 Tax=Micromonospora sp. WMMA1998 TaxID=3015167 RepID=UPI00248CAF71|nr:hypothetical protein [Micromonospora sp. WMMA1998]WBC14032.1 hypothetical protein O7600_23405 [Micromonospora sp. WMMA1998]